MDPDSYRSRIRRFDLTTANITLPIDFQMGEVFADGLRNEVGLAFDSFGSFGGLSIVLIISSERIWEVISTMTPSKYHTQWKNEKTLIRLTFLCGEGRGIESFSRRRCWKALAM